MRAKWRNDIDNFNYIIIVLLIMKNIFGAYPSLTTYLGEKRLLTVGNEALVSVIRPHTAKQGRMLVAVTRDGYRTDYPIRYDNGSVAFDNPEWFSKRFLMRATPHIRKFDELDNSK